MAKVKKTKSKGAKTSSEEMAVKGAIPLSFYRKAVRNTEKKFSLTSSSLQVPFRQSFGLLIFDLLSGGGIIPGFMVQISGKEGSGKCLKGDSLVPTSKGIMRLDELYNNTNDKVVITHKHVKKQLTGSYKTSGKTISITTNYGDVVEGLAEHRMWVYRGAQLGFCRLDAIKAGDWLPKSLGTNLFPKETPKFNYSYKESDYRDVTQFDVKIPKVMTEEFAELLGLYIAEGHKGRFTNYNKEILERYIQLIYKVFGASRSLEASETVIGFGKIITDFINTLVPETTSAFKQIPLVIRQSPRKIQTAFIRGLFEGDASVYTKNSNNKKSSVLEFCSISKRLTYEAKAILENMGIACYVTVGEKYASNTENKRKVTAYKLIVMQPYLSKYENDINFISQDKIVLLNNAVERVNNYNEYSTKSVGRINTMPGVYWLHELKLAIKKILDTSINEKTGKPFGMSALVPYYLRDKNNKDIKFTSIFSNLESNKCKNINREQIAYLAHVLRVDSPLNKKVWSDRVVRDCLKNLIALTKETWAQVKTVTKNRKIETVYDLEVAEDSSYHVNGLIGHNSTLSGHLFRSSILSNIPIIEYRDPENALTDSMMENIVRYKDPTSLFSGAEQRAFYYPDSGLEVFYNSIKHTLKALPDKMWDQERKSWFYVFDADKAGRAMMAEAGFSKYDKQKFQDTGRLWVPTDDGAPQGIVILDSYPALLTEKDDEDDETSNVMALDARAFSKNIKRVAGRLKRKAFIIMGVNQIRDRPGVMYGPTEYEPGGNALAFYSSLRFQVRKVSVPQGMPKGKTDDGNDSSEYSTEKSIYGGGRRDSYVYINVRNTKNKGGAPLMRAKMRILFSDGKGRMLGYDPVWDVLEYLKILGRRSGNFKKGFQLNVPGMDKKFKGFSKRTLDYLDLKLLIMAEHLKEKKLIKRVEKELKLKPILIKTLLAEMRKSPTAVRDLLESADEGRKELKDDDGQADLEA